MEDSVFDRSPPSAEAWDRLITSLKGLKKGVLADYVSEFVTVLGLPPEQGRLAFVDMMREVLDLENVPPSLARAEKSQKVGTSSMTAGYFNRVPGRVSMSDTIQRYFTRKKTSINKESACFANEALGNWLRKGSVRLMSLYDTLEHFEEKRARGWPWMLTVAGVPLCYLNEAEKITMDGLDLSHASAYPGTLNTRSSVAGFGQLANSRVIYGTSLVTNLLGMQVFKPVSARLKGRPTFCAWQSRAAVDLAVTGVMKRARGDILSIDFSKFDVSVPPEVIGFAFDALERWFHVGDRAHVRFCREAFLRTGIFVPSVQGDFDYFDGLDREGGIPSGSILTNLIGSMVNFWVMTYVSHRLGLRVLDALLQGDDGVYTFDKRYSVSDLADVLLVELGMLLSVSKSLCGRRVVTFLQNVFDFDHQVEGIIVGRRPATRVLVNMSNYEKKRAENLTEYDDYLRWLQQLDNMSTHPSFMTMVEWFLDHSSPVLFQVLGNMMMNRVENPRWDGLADVVSDRMDLLSDFYVAPTLRALNLILSRRLHGRQ